MKSAQKGFTLIELLVVIAIIAVLSVVVVLTLNPAELLRQARDSNRISDLNTMKSAISLFLVDTASSTGLLGSGGVATNCYVSNDDAVIGTSSAAVCALISPAYVATSTVTDANAPLINGNGWIPINFTAISSGAPIGSLPVDVVNTNDNKYFYRASATSTTFKMAGRMESSKYGPGGTSDVSTNDGGNTAGFYE
ncbi:MAG: type II secretion system protein, partial [bacterium]|nr:type II secretion system protein [bacterium]